MKLIGRGAAAYFSRPDMERIGLLIYGGDAMRVALRRQQVIAAMTGSGGGKEMRITRLSASACRKDPAALADAIKARGFFPGPRVVFVEDASDALTKIVEAALVDWKSEDARIVITAGRLNARSALRKLFEAHPNAYVIGLYDDPPDQAEIETILRTAGLTDLREDAMAALQVLAGELDPGEFRQSVEKLSLYKLNDDTAVSPDDIEICAPATIEAAVDDFLTLVAEARTDEIGPMMRKLKGQGVQPVSLCINTVRYFRMLHAAACDPEGPLAGLARIRPPVFGPRRDRMARQARSWGVRRLESALALVTDTDLQLRSAGQTAPAMALVERAAIRLAMMGGYKDV